MTTGRMEASVHTGPLFKEAMPHWASFNRDPAYSLRKFDAETRQKESCPFHDLRAEGQFQPEIYTMGEGDARPDPGFLVRKDGPRMRCALASGPHLGCGGSGVPFDTAPQPPPARPRHDRPWASTAKSDRLFMRPLYEPLGPTVPPGSQREKLPHFHTGKMQHKPAPYEHKPESHVPEKPKKPFRLRCGKGPGLFDPYAYRGDQMVSPPDEKPKSKNVPPPPLLLRRNIENTFGKYPAYMPHTRPEDNMPRKQPKKSLRPIYTWATKTKRTMPVAAQWSVSKVRVE